MWLLITFAVLAGMFYAFNSYIYQQKQSVDQTFEPYRASLSGEYICLPNSEEITEGECMYGIKTEADELYSINFMLMSQMPPQVMPGDTIRGNGVITPVERLSADYYRTNGIQGVFSVTDSLEVLE